ncbi:MAG: nucleotidyltransferase [Caldilineaceae bacterium SB0665_bin_25]|nr:nucleotidyltransferase [Caldilineaceae bacterium SB0665_bin_25]
MAISTEQIRRCIRTLRAARDGLQQYEAGDVLYEICRAACVKEFELVLEQSGRLLRRRLRPYFASNRQADQLTFNDVFRYAAKHCLISGDACERWLEYRAMRNETAHEYGEHFAERTLEALSTFIADAEELVYAIEEGQDDSPAAP